MRAPRLRVHGVQGDGFRWTTVLHAYDGRACPKCGVLVIGSNHRAQHLSVHDQLEALEEAVRVLSRAVRTLAVEAGHDDWYRPVEARGMTGVVIGSGPL